MASSSELLASLGVASESKPRREHDLFPGAIEPIPPYATPSPTSPLPLPPPTNRDAASAPAALKTPLDGPLWPDLSPCSSEELPDPLLLSPLDPNPFVEPDLLRPPSPPPFPSTTSSNLPLPSSTCLLPGEVVIDRPIDGRRRVGERAETGR
ncbi:MAG: hypothetical protein SGPRY_002073, partial [Prymnesium sp.]